MDRMVPYLCCKKISAIVIKVCKRVLSSLSSIDIVRDLKRSHEFSQPAITCSKLTIETLELGVKYVQS